MTSPSRRARRSTRQRVLLTAGVLATTLCLLGAAGVGYAYVRYNSITRYDVALPPAAEGAPRNFLLVGSDSREGLDPTDPDYGGFVDGSDSGAGGQRTDTIMILRVDPEAEEADLISLPRDLYLPIGGLDGREDRINAAFADGRQTLIDTVQEDLGIPIHHYVEVSFSGFKDLVDAIGDVEMYFDSPLRDPNTGLEIASPGCVSLDSIESLQFVRSRHLEILEDGRWVTDPTGDLGRISRQQLFVRHALGQALSKGLSNPIRLNELVGVGVDNVGLDPGLGVQELLSFGRRFAEFDEDTLRTHTLDVVPFSTSAGAAVLDLDEEASQDALNVFRGLPPGTVAPQFVDVTVLNGGGQQGQATEVAGALGDIGFAIDVVGDSEPYPRTAIYFAPGSEGSALQLVGHLSSRAELLVDPNLEEDSVVLVIGSDFSTVHREPAVEDLPRTAAGRHDLDVRYGGRRGRRVRTGHDHDDDARRLRARRVERIELRLMQATRLLDHPIIGPDTDPSIGDNIQGPSMVRAPNWLTGAPGRYLLYFADHKGGYIRLAHADEVVGPWTVHVPGSLKLADSCFLTEPPEATAEQLDGLEALYREILGTASIPHSMLTEATTPHIASPDVLIDDDRRQFVMYFHGLEALGWQLTRAAVSSNGVDFVARPEILGRPYFRGFRWNGQTHAMAMPGVFHRSDDGLSDFEEGPTLFENLMRHSALVVRDDVLHVFWTRVGDAPESILHSTVELTPDWHDWEASEPTVVLRPDRDWEGADAPVEPSRRSTAHGHVNQLRDPAIFVDEDGRTYLLYAVAGECGIAIAEIEW